MSNLLFKNWVIIIKLYLFQCEKRVKLIVFEVERDVIKINKLILTLSNFCSLDMFAMPPQKRDDPRTKRRLERIEPNSEYFTTSILLWIMAKIEIINSVAFPHVAFRSPPTATKFKK